jgi:hypothetical protein
MGPLGCRDAPCDDELVERAVAFVEAHQSCETNDDCRIVGDFCREVPGGQCGQIQLSREGEESAEWRAIEVDFEDCGPSECTQCLLALEASCFEGSCGYSRDAPANQ